VDLGLSNRNVLVTGATRGIGLRIARQFADEGANVGICARTPEAVAATVEELSARGVHAVGRDVDITDPDEYPAWILWCAEQLGGIDVFVSNVSAGPADPGEKGWRAMFESDLLGAVRGVETALPWLRQSEVASTVFVSSISGVMSKALKAPGIHAYGAIKAALISYGAQLSKTLAPEGIRVNVVSPGPIFFEGGPWDYIRKEMPEAYREALEQCVIGRLGTPEEVAAAVVFLASPVSGFTVGQNLHVDGGYMQHVPY